MDEISYNVGKENTMPLQYFKPNKSIKGSAASFGLNSKKGSVFVSIIKQTSYNEERHVGGFKEGKRANIQFGMFEIGSIINSIEKNVEFKTVHKSDKFTTNISFSPYLKDGKQLGFGLSIYRQDGEEKESFLIGFNFSELVVLREWLKFALQHCFTAIYSVDKKEAEDYQKRKEADASKQQNEVKKADDTQEEIVL